MSAQPIWQIGGMVKIGGDSYLTIEDDGPEVPCIVALVPFNTIDGKTNRQEEHGKLIGAAPDLLTACKAPELDAAHDKLSELLEDPEAENDDIRGAAVDLCMILVAHYETRLAAIAKAEGAK